MGRKRILQIGLVLFALTSLAAAQAPAVIDALKSSFMTGVRAEKQAEVADGTADPYGVMTMRALALPCRTSAMDSLTEARGLVW